MLHVVGQAPSRTGDGRPFTGYSGQRLVKLFGFNSYDHMAARVNLLNLLHTQAEPLPDGRGDRFDYTAAKLEARRLAVSWLVFYPETHVIACGQKVFKCFSSRRGEMFRGVALRDRHSGAWPFTDGTVVKVWFFPHPSGASAFWNEPENVDQAAKFLRRRLRIADQLHD